MPPKRDINFHKIKNSFDIITNENKLINMEEKEELQKRIIILENENKLLKNQQLKYRNLIMNHKSTIDKLQNDLQKFFSHHW